MLQSSLYPSLSDTRPLGGAECHAVEPALLISLQMLVPSGSMVQVGNPQQLLVTVISQAAQKAGPMVSLFERSRQLRLC